MRKTVPSSLTALGKESLPPSVEVRGRTYLHRQTFKNDFFAVTALYQSENDKIILKLGRRASFLFLPLRWVGRVLAAREQSLLQRLDDVEGVPRFIDRWGATGIIREYVEGHTLARGERVRDDFHALLRALVKVLHSRRMAYVDLEKCENVIVGEDGRPHLIDFQISWYLPRRWGGELWPARKLRKWLQTGDLYHLLKLQRRTRPDQLSPDALASSYRKPWYVRLHWTVTWPFTQVRRAILHHVDPRRPGRERGRVAPGDKQAKGVAL